MIQTNQKAWFYHENEADYLLTFQPAQTWTISSGTGTATITTENAFNGVKSLKLDNTAPATDLVATNAVQTSVVPITGNYGVTVFIYKKHALEVVTGLVNIYKNAVLLSAETFSLGSTVAADDIDQQWTQFSVSGLALAATDDITFTFQIDGSGTALGSVQLYFGGISLYRQDRRVISPPFYVSPPAPDAGSIAGWGFYADAETTPATQTITTTASKLQIDGGGSATETTYLPTGITNFWDTSSDLITPEAVGDGYVLRVDFEITAEGANPNSIFFELDIGGGGSPSNVVVSRTQAAGGTTPYTISVGFPVTITSTFLTNGGQIFLSTDTGTVTVATRAILIMRTYKSI